MIRTLFWLFVDVCCMFSVAMQAQADDPKSVTIPIILDHNRMLYDGEIQRRDGSWRAVRFWVDTGNPDFLISEELARDLGIDFPDTLDRIKNGRFETPPLSGLRVGRMLLNFDEIPTQIWAKPKFMFNTMHIDANLPSVAMQRYDILFDYPGLCMTIGQPGTLKFRGARSAATIKPETGIIQLDALIDGDTLSFALDNGVAYSVVSDEIVTRFTRRHPEWPHSAGAVGCANIWGWWPGEPEWPILRFPDIVWGSAHLEGIGIVGLPKEFPLTTWYSQKTTKPVDGLLGPNAFKAFRVGIDYAKSAIYFEKTASFDREDLDVVGLTLQPQADGSYQVLGVATQNGKPTVDGVEPGDVLLQIDGLQATGATMGIVIDALRGKQGDTHILLLDRGGRQIKVDAKVVRFL